MAASERIYDIVLFGATGYTGEYTAEHITTNLRTDLSWAVAGRSQQKLEALVKKLKQLNPDRKQPAIETAQLSLGDLRALAKKTKVLLNTVGPYALYGEPVVAACAENGTHYLDVTGESPWVYDMIQSYDKKAKESGAIIIPQIGVESAPAEMLTYALASTLRREAKVHTREAIVTLHALRNSASGGTLATVLNLGQKYSVSEIMRASTAQSVCPIPVTPAPPTSLMTRIVGVRSVPDLGTLTTSIQASADIPIVHRSWGLLSSPNLDTDESYGPNFSFRAYMTARNSFTGTLIHLAMTLGPILLFLPPVRWLLQKVIYQPGQGPAREEAANQFLKYKGVAVADSKMKQRAIGSLSWQGNAYHLTGVFLAEAAECILQDKNITAKKLGGGLLTPATLGQAYIDRLSKVGVEIETKMLPH